MIRKLIVIDEVNVKLEGFSYDELTELINKSKIADPKAFTTPSFKIGAWDGKHAFIDENGFSFYYLLDDMMQWMLDIGVDPCALEIEDLRDDNFVYRPQDVSSDFLAEYGYTLRYYQVDGVNAVFGEEKGFIHAATGAGKSLMCAALCKSYEKGDLNTLTVVPSDKLLNDTHKLYENVDLNACKFKGKNKAQLAQNSQHIVTTWQTLNNNYQDLPKIDVLIYDEAHIMGDAIYQLLAQHLGNVPVRVGLTASPPFKNKYKWTKIRCAIGGDVLYTISPKELIDQGYIANLDVTMYGIRHDEFDWFTEWPKEQEYLNSNKARLVAIADFIKNLNGENTLILSHAQVAEALSILMGIDFIDKDVDTETREEYFGKFAQRSDYILAGSWGTSATGISVDDIFNLVIVDAGADITRIIQGIGRGLRKDSKNRNHLKVFDLFSLSRYSERHAKKRKSQYKELSYPFVDKQPIIVAT